MAFKFVKNLLTFANAKTIKGEKYGWHTAILYLAPAKLSGTNVCRFSTAECREVCLNTAGRGAFNSIQKSRLNKTRWMLEEPETFFAQLSDEIERLSRKHRNLAVRLNGTSDIINADIAALMYRFPDTQFYDYSKDVNRCVLWLHGELPSNYHLTYSYGGGDTRNAISFLRDGMNVAVVFDTKRGKPLPKSWNGFNVIDGDEHDLRFLDKGKGVVVGLRAKGKARTIKSKSGFVQSGFKEVQS